MRTIKYVTTISGILLMILGVGLFLFFWNDQLPALSNNTVDKKQIQLADQESTETDLLDVPLENQQSGAIPLENGCEITALSMLLNFYDYGTTKNQLADLLNYVPLYENEELAIHGNPHEGFVGNIYEGYDAMGAAVEPIAEVAEQIITGDHSIVASRETPFSMLEQLVQQGVPVWVVTTVDFQVPTEEDFRIWQTTAGEVEISPLCHAVIITGMDQEYIYVNDPYGYKNRIVNREDFETIYATMGSQSLYLQTDH